VSSPHAGHATTHHVMWQLTHLQQLQQKIQKYPTCREPLSDTRNKALEKLAVRVECPCPNKPQGCTLTFPIVLIREHQDVCEYNPLVCPLRKVAHCRWKGPFEEIKHHVTQKHRNLVTNMWGMTDVLIKKFHKNNVQVRIILLTNCGRVTQICVFNTVKLGTSASSP
jgi:hypothetical protein